MRKWTKCSVCENAIVTRICTMENTVFELHFDSVKGYLSLYNYKEGYTPDKYHGFPVLFFSLFRTYYSDVLKPKFLSVSDYYDAEKNKLWFNDTWIDMNNAFDAVFKQCIEIMCMEMRQDNRCRYLLPKNIYDLLKQQDAAQKYITQRLAADEYGDVRQQVETRIQNNLTWLDENEGTIVEMLKKSNQFVTEQDALMKERFVKISGVVDDAFNAIKLNTE